MEGRDYMIVNQKIWDFFVGKYGLINENHVIKRYPLKGEYIQVDLQQYKIYCIPNNYTNF